MHISISCAYVHCKWILSVKGHFLSKCLFFFLLFYILYTVTVWAFDLAVTLIYSHYVGSRDATRMSCSSPFPRSPLPSAPASPHPPTFNSLSNQPPPLPEKKTVSRTVSAPDNGKAFIRSYPRLPFTGSESNVCQPEAGSQSSLPSSPVDPRAMFSSHECLERCHAPLGKPSRSI